MKTLIQKIKTIFLEKKQMILYLFFGGITTVCSLLACYLTLRVGVLFWHDENGDPTVLVDVLGSTTQWVVGVLMAFFTSKKWVFTEAERGALAATKQFGIFCSSRVLTYFLEVAVNLGVIALLNDLLGYRAPVLALFGRELELSARLWAKIISSVFVFVSNYYISKLLVFRKKDPKEQKEQKDEKE